MPEIAYTSTHRMLAAAIRLRDALHPATFDVNEIDEAALGLMAATGTTNLQAALIVLVDVQAGP